MILITILTLMGVCRRQDSSRSVELRRMELKCGQLSTSVANRHHAAATNHPPDHSRNVFNQYLYHVNARILDFPRDHNNAYYPSF